MNKNNMMGKTLGVLVTGAILGLCLSAFAEETTGEKITSGARDVKVDAKKSVRKGKKKVRNATGNGSIVEDAKDVGNNTMDSMDAGAKKMKDKVD